LSEGFPFREKGHDKECTEGRVIAQDEEGQRAPWHRKVTTTSPESFLSGEERCLGKAPERGRVHGDVQEKETSEIKKQGGVKREDSTSNK